MSNKKMKAPVYFPVWLEAEHISRLDRQAKALTKKTGYKVYKADVIREVLSHYLNVSGA